MRSVRYEPVDVLWSGTPYPSHDAYGPIEACKIPTVLSGRCRIAPALAGDTPTPHRTLYAPSVVRRARAPQSAPAGHRPTGPGRSRHRPRVHSPGRRYPSLRVIGPVEAAEHMSDGRTRARRTFPGQPRCALRARLSYEPDGRGTNGLRDRRLTSRSESARNLLHWRITAKGRQSAYGPPESPAPRERSRRPNSSAVAKPALEGSPASWPPQVGGPAGGPATQKQ